MRAGYDRLCEAIRSGVVLSGDGGAGDTKELEQSIAASETELEHVVKTNSMLQSRVNVISFLGTASLIAIGIAFTSSKAVVLYVAAALLALQAVAEHRMYRILVAVTTRGVVLQRRIHASEPDTWLQALPTRSTVHAMTLADLPPEDRAKELRSLRLRSRWGNLSAVAAAFVAITATVLGAAGTLAWA